MTPRTIGIIGYGNMGSAIVKGLVDAGVFMPSDIHVADVDDGKLKKARAEGYFTHGSVRELAELSGTIVAAVKPGNLADVLGELRDIPDDRLVVSIAAGVTLSVLERALPDNPVIRVMPNTPAMVGAGVSVFSRGSKAGGEHAGYVRKILGAVGYVCEVPEPLMDAVTGLSGSGPAYAAVVIDALAEGGVLMGLRRDTALELAARTVLGASRMILERGLHPAELRDMVASPGGTTIEGISVLEDGAVRSALIRAVEAAALKARELSE